MNEIIESQMDKEKIFNDLQKNLYDKYNISVELGRTSGLNSLYVAEFGKAYRENLSELKVGRPIYLDVEISPEIKPMVRPVVNVYADNRLVVKGYPILIEDDNNDKILGRIGVLITKVVDDTCGIKNLIKNNILELDNTYFFADDPVGSPHNPPPYDYYPTLLFNVYKEDILIAKGRPSNPGNILGFSPDVVERHFCILITELFSTIPK